MVHGQTTWTDKMTVEKWDCCLVLAHHDDLNLPSAVHMFTRAVLHQWLFDGSTKCSTHHNTPSNRKVSISEHHPANETANPHQVIQRCISLLGAVVPHRALWVYSCLASPNQFRIARADRPKSDRADVQRATGTSQFSLEWSCPRCVGRSFHQSWVQSQVSYCALGRLSKSSHHCCRWSHAWGIWFLSHDQVPPDSQDWFGTCSSGIHLPGAGPLHVLRRRSHHRARSLLHQSSSCKNTLAQQPLLQTELQASQQAPRWQHFQMPNFSCRSWPVEVATQTQRGQPFSRSDSNIIMKRCVIESGIAIPTSQTSCLSTDLVYKRWRCADKETCSDQRWRVRESSLHSGVGWSMSWGSSGSFASFTIADIVSAATSFSTSRHAPRLCAPSSFVLCTSASPRSWRIVTRVWISALSSSAVWALADSNCSCVSNVAIPPVSTWSSCCCFWSTSCICSAVAITMHKHLLRYHCELWALWPISLCSCGCATASVSRCPDDNAQSFHAMSNARMLKVLSHASAWCHLHIRISSRVTLRTGSQMCACTDTEIRRREPHRITVRTRDR